MKKLLLASAMALFSLSNAQIKPGTVYVSGQVGYTQKKNNNTEDDTKVFKIMPSVGVFVAPNLAVGTGIGYHNGKSAKNEFYSEGSSYSNHATFTNETTSFSVAPFVRKYWILSENLYIFGHLEIPVEIGKENWGVNAVFMDPMNGFYHTQSMSIEKKYTAFGVNIKPGLDYFVNKNWSIEATIGEFGYRHLKIKDQEKGTNDFNLGINLSSVTFGVKYVFAK